MPRPYMSWSQLNLWKTEPEEYKRAYFGDTDTFVNRRMLFGRMFADAYAENLPSDEPKVNFIRMMLPEAPKREEPILVEKEGLPLFGKLDGWWPRERIIEEIKTGRKWTQSMVDKHGQLTFYAMLIYLKYGKLPKKIRLHWAETAEDDFGEIYLTGRLKTFQAKRSLADVLLMWRQTKDAWEEIYQVALELRK